MSKILTFTVICDTEHEKTSEDKSIVVNINGNILEFEDQSSKGEGEATESESTEDESVDELIEDTTSNESDEAELE